LTVRAQTELPGALGARASRPHGVLDSRPVSEHGVTFLRGKDPGRSGRKPQSRPRRRPGTA